MARLPRMATCALGIVTIVACATLVHGQEGSSWRPATEGGSRSGAGYGPAGDRSAARADDVTPIGSGAASQGPASTRAKVSKGRDSLPRDHGQVWREYDLRPYTERVGDTVRPEQAIVDWVLRETGYEAWHSEPVGVLSAGRDVLRVYHTPEMQAVVADMVDRFVNQAATAYAFTLRVATVRNPNWRARALPIMTPVPVQSPGVQGWLLAKEDARLLVAELSRRTDYREYNSSQQLVANGQSIVLSTMRPRSYIKGAVPTQTAWPGYQPETGTIDEGFSLEFSPLLAHDLASADAVVKLRLHQVEKMLPVKLDLPTLVAPNQRVQVDVPQLTMAHLNERFRWPTDRVLLLSMGVVATPGPSRDNPLTDAMTDAMPMFKSPPRADALLFIECTSALTPSPDAPQERAAALPQQFQGRY